MENPSQSFNNSSSPLLSEPSNNNSNIISCIFIWLELIILHPSILIISNINLFVLLTTKVLHPNMSVILIVQSISIIGFETFRIIAIIETLIVCDVYYSGSIITQVLLSILNSISSMKSNDITFTNIITIILMVMLNLIEFLTILAIGFYNKHKYNKYMPQGNNYSLSEKYQLSENIRTSKQLIPVFFCHCFNGCVMLFFTIFMYFSLFSHQQLGIAIQAGTILASLVDFIIELTVITHHPQLRKRFLLILAKTFLFKCLNNKVSDGETKQIEEAQRSNSGRLMKNKGNSESHFNIPLSTKALLLISSCQQRMAPKSKSALILFAKT
uniref:G-protein coupled receptors family 1 profile domain-containing protein n=1 Tax=Meloidogyne floridensis TaxID=298350 RepID=A0A915NDY1_9BILA